MVAADGERSPNEFSPSAVGDLEAPGEDIVPPAVWSGESPSGYVYTFPPVGDRASARLPVAGAFVLSPDDTMRMCLTTTDPQALRAVSPSGMTVRRGSPCGRATDPDPLSGTKATASGASRPTARVRWTRT